MPKMSESLTHRVHAANGLGFRLLSYLTADEGTAGKNLFLSSFSVAIALAMVYNGADGEAKEALSAILELDDSSLKEVNEANATFLALGTSLDPEVTLVMANSIWVKVGLTLAPEFVRRIADDYAGTVAQLDFSNPEEASGVINEWVGKETQEKIQELLSPKQVAEAILVLVSVVYFKGNWTRPFDERLTSKRMFTCANGERKWLAMMEQLGTWQYAETEMFQGVVLPYGDRRVSMHVLLPKPDVPLATFRDYLTLDRWRAWLSSTASKQGSLALPRFKVRYNENLVDALIYLGGEGLKGPAFPGMGVGELTTTAVVHEAVLEVNEEGAEAAAATAVVMARGIPSHFFMMVVERPFFCAVCDQQTGLILFMGWILDPE